MSDPCFVDMLGLSSVMSRKAYIQSLREDINRCLDESAYTPDATNLQRWDYQDVFIIGTWKRGFKRHNILGNDVMALGVGYTNSKSFVMYRTSGSNNYPVVLIDQSNKVKTGAIYGEIWRIPTSNMFSLDFYESNTVESRRLRVPIKYIGTDGKFHTMSCWMWLGLRSVWNPKIDSPDKPRSLTICDVQTMSNKTLGPEFPYYNYMWRYHNNPEE